MKAVLFVGIGSFVGGVLRYWVARFIPLLFTSYFPFATFIVNLVGCFLIGVFYSMSQRIAWFTDDFRLLLMVGLCGGFTTFSAFANENIQLLRDGQWGYAVAYTVASVLLGILSTYLGLVLSK